jgi:hypothetical protein
MDEQKLKQIIRDAIVNAHNTLKAADAFNKNGN